MMLLFNYDNVVPKKAAPIIPASLPSVAAVILVFNESPPYISSCTYFVTGFDKYSFCALIPPPNTTIVGSKTLIRFVTPHAIFLKYVSNTSFAVLSPACAASKTFF